MCTKRYVWVFLSLSVCIALTVITSCAKVNGSEEKEVQLEKAFVFQGKTTSPITFLSTQMNPVEEAGKMRKVILKDFPGIVDFRPNDSSFLSVQIDSVLEKDPSASILVGALHGDLLTLSEKDALQPVDSIYEKLVERSFSENLLKLTRMNGKDMFYIPWMQASFVMVANKKALAYLPLGANLDELSYEQLALWSKNIFEKTGMKALGFPSGAKGLMHRFFQGYLYPSFTASTLVKFRGEDAKRMWEYFKDLWSVVAPSSLVYSTMADPLLAGDVWIAWDHTARLVKVFENMPDDFVAFPAPVGPKGRGYMPVISGLAIPKKTADIQDPSLLIDYLTQEVIQKPGFI
ncbi:extracellular solute-binding protein [uncultured Sphaerochaeta sp.]|uniref:extracellular solute-binding protein n=1 Tax=uncultured Sphaerochaeta sp. TaxID=886478 RepID=UPI002A0A202A|nr:extracellular solute-binding protein [uncultured Sphaerochaeta sp.]